MPDEQKEVTPGLNLLSPESGSGLERPETVVEQTPEAGLQTSHQEVPPEPMPAMPAVSEMPVQRSVVLPPVKDPVLADVENILSENLGEVYKELPENKRGAFKVKGEELAEKIRLMITSGKLKLGNVLKSIREWLRMIPGVNRFFLEQEAKIKADKIAAYAKEAQGKVHNSI